MSTISHCSKEVIWPSPKSRGRGMYSTHTEAMARARMQEGMKDCGQEFNLPDLLSPGIPETLATKLRYEGS